MNDKGCGTVWGGDDGGDDGGKRVDALVRLSRPVGLDIWQFWSHIVYADKYIREKWKSRKFGETRRLLATHGAGREIKLRFWESVGGKRRKPEGDECGSEAKRKSEGRGVNWRERYYKLKGAEYMCIYTNAISRTSDHCSVLDQLFQRSIPDWMW